ncbi:MAG TPA: MXAN_6640 family putative metalloprotease [Clostridia bacterium]|nr:MXAN_6640 family putative metalloprotease [Clostridia bacterium]
MSARRSARMIKGTVYHDTGRYGRQGEPGPLLKGIGINLFLPADRGIQNENGKNIKIRRDKLISRTQTNDKGEFRFFASDCEFIVCLDVATLPAGTAVKSQYRTVPKGEAGDIRFAIRDIQPKNKDDGRYGFDKAETGLCSADRIRLAFSTGLIDENTKMKYMARALFNSHQLPKEYQSRVPMKSGTGILDELNRYLKGRSADTSVSEAVRQAVAYSVPELDKSYRSPGRNFNIHYTLSGENAVDFNYRDPEAVPPYITQVAEAFENVRALTCVSRGYREPLLEEGKDYYDIYVYDLKDKYGVTFSSKMYGSQNRAGTASSYICIDNSYSREKGFDKSRLECMRVTAAHEYFHAVQYAYNVEADAWWKEASATWNEDEVYTGINDYVRYIRKYFKTPGLSLDKTSYSGVIFAKFLSQYYGGFDTMRRIWELQASGYNNSIQAIDRFIRTHYAGKDIGSVYNQFSTYNTNPAQYYKEGAAWNLAASAQNSYAKYPVSADTGRLDHLASNYQLFRPADTERDRSLKLTIEGVEGRWGFTLQKRSSRTKQYSITEILSRGIYDRAEIELGGFGTTFDEVWLIPSNLEMVHDRMVYAYTADTE